MALLIGVLTCQVQAQDTSPPPAPAVPASQPASTPDGSDWGDEAPTKPSFDIEVQCADDGLRTLLENHLELYRYRALSDLSGLELERLLGRAEDNAEDLLGTQGYFSPTITLTQIPAAERAPAAELPLIRISVEPGPATTIANYTLNFSGDIANPDADGSIRSQRTRIQRTWSLRKGTRFTQDAWAGAKSSALTQLTTSHYPRGRVSESRATVDASINSASLAVSLDSGPRFYLGNIHTQGLSRYDERTVRNFARLKPGDDYSLDGLLAAQQRLSDSGYFDSVFLHVDPEDAHPEAATVQVQVQEARYQKLTIGPGYSTDSGPRITLDHRYNQVPLLGWQASTQLQLDRDTQLLQTTLSSIPDDDYWRWVAAGNIQRQVDSTETTTSAQASFGRSFTSDDFDRSYYLQFDRTHTKNANAIDDVSAVSGNWSWTRRRFNSVKMPTRGWGLGVELGVGTTFGNAYTPFTRARLRSVAYFPLPRASRNGRFVVRGDLGGVFAKSGTELPTTLLFRTGGDTTVRGYAYRSIGVSQPNDVISSGRYMTVGSIEYQRPILVNGRPSTWEWAVFTDTGSVADKPQQMTFYTGVGAGLRWRSPVGPLQLDVAYGLKTHEPRLHFNIGFVF